MVERKIKSICDMRISHEIWISVSPNKVLSEYKTPIQVHVAYSCFPSTAAELRSCAERSAAGPLSPKQLLFGPLQKRSAESSLSCTPRMEMLKRSESVSYFTCFPGWFCPCPRPSPVCEHSQHLHGREGDTDLLQNDRSYLCGYMWVVIVACYSSGKPIIIILSEELMPLNCGVTEDSWESLGLQGDPTRPS